MFQLVISVSVSVPYKKRWWGNITVTCYVGNLLVEFGKRYLTQRVTGGYITPEYSINSAAYSLWTSALPPPSRSQSVHLTPRRKMKQVTVSNFSYLSGEAPLHLTNKCSANLKANRWIFLFYNWRTTDCFRDGQWKWTVDPCFSKHKSHCCSYGQYKSAVLVWLVVRFFH